MIELKADLSNLDEWWDAEEEANPILPEVSPARPTKKSENTNPESLSEILKELSDPIVSLRQFSLKGHSTRLRRMMQDDSYALKGLAILGQWTTFYAAPNVGKTLITLSLLLDSVKNLEIDPDKVFYINADDNFRGLVSKLEIIEEHGIHMVAPNQNGFSVSNLIELLENFAITENAVGTVIIIDTLKKFTDLMDKRRSSIFGQKAREYVSCGGTLIALAHTNKHKNSEGRSVFAGTSDIRDDSDCVYIIEKISEIEGETTIEFVNDKSRGDVEDTVGFSYKRVKGQTYRNLLDSVVRLKQGSVQNMRGQAEVARKLAEDEEVITLISEAVVSGTVLKTEIVKYVNGQSGLSQRIIKDVLDRRTGTIYELGHRWRSTREEHNRHRYELLPAPSLNNCKTEKLTK